MKTLVTILALLVSGLVNAQNPAPASPPPAKSGEEYSGMYAFLRDGEFVQLTIEDARVTGFVSRYGDTDSDRGSFLDQFIKEGKLEGNNLTFTTKTVHGTFYDFKGTVERGDGKSPGDEAYYVLKGTLTQSTMDDAQKTLTKVREVRLKSFPNDAGAEPPK
jgi:hypothetical protein